MHWQVDTHTHTNTHSHYTHNCFFFTHKISMITDNITTIFFIQDAASLLHRSLDVSVAVLLFSFKYKTQTFWSVTKKQPKTKLHVAELYLAMLHTFGLTSDLKHDCPYDLVRFSSVTNSDSFWSEKGWSSTSSVSCRWELSLRLLVFGCVSLSFQVVAAVWTFGRP